jgi:hypothetical protein
MKNDLLAAGPSVVNVGLDMFVGSVRDAGAPIAHLDWRPSGDGDAALAWKLALLAGDADDAQAPGSRIDAANEIATQRMLAAQPMLVDVRRAAEVWPELWANGRKTLTHAGAPVEWSRMCDPMKGTLIGAMLYEGWAQDEADARRQLAAGEVTFLQNHDIAAVGPMSGVISPSQPVFVVTNKAEPGNTAYTNFSEGIGRVLRFGAFGPDVIKRLKWIEGTLAPALKAALAGIEGGIDLKSIQAQALLMGDEVHSRNAAATALLHMAVGGAMMGSSIERAKGREALDFIANTSQFFLNLSMVASKCIMDAAHGVPHSSIVTAIARNGVTTAIRVSGLGRRWFQSPSDTPVGLFFPGFKQEDANADLGDSAICETAGYGGLSLAASPALVQLVGGTVAQAMAYSREMYNVTWTRNPSMSLPTLEFAPAPAGIDVRKVVDTGIRPVLTTGIAHQQAGVGQIGAGIVRTPLPCYTQAVLALAEDLGC